MTTPHHGETYTGMGVPLPDLIPTLQDALPAATTTAVSVPLFPVVEAFGPTIQGEGVLAGQRTMFVRFGGCDLIASGACRWCDSMHAVDVAKYKDRWSKITATEILDLLQTLALGSNCRTVTLSGGNPVLYDLAPLVNLLHERGWRICVETQGTVWKDWVGDCDVITVSPKPPSAGLYDVGKFHDFLGHLAEVEEWEKEFFSVCVKIPIDPDFDKGADLMFASRLILECCNRGWTLDYALSVVTYPQDDLEAVVARWRDVVDWYLRIRWPRAAMTMVSLPQLHVVLWGHKLGV